VSASSWAKLATTLPSLMMSSRLFLRIVAGHADRLARQHRAQQRLEHQAAAQRLEDHGDVEAAAAEAAVGLAEQRADHAEFGELLEDFLAEPVLRLRDAVARSKAYCSAMKRFRLSASMRRSSVCSKFICMSPYRPRIILLMMFFWISLEPPKIDSLRLLK
jgi:DNA-binding transcriptional MocR family regulator